jgi:hypothetical protein
MSRTVAFGRDVLGAPDVDIEVLLYLEGNTSITEVGTVYNRCC